MLVASTGKPREEVLQALNAANGDPDTAASLLLAL
jgi:NACalpha-BTF3-like transcription factor